MKLMVVGINYEPEIISTGVYTTGMADYMATNGVETHVVTARPYYPAWRTFPGWRSLTWKKRCTETGVRVVHCPIYVPSRPSGARRILHYISFATTSFPVLLWKALHLRPDIIMLVAPSIISAPGVLASAKLSGANSWLHIQDYEVEAAFATGLLKEDSRIGRLAKRFERWMLGKFSRVSSISQPMIAKLHEKNVSEHQTVELRNWANLESVTPLESPSLLKKELGITTPYIALYSGNLANKQGLEILPQMAAYLKDRKDLTIAICGDGPMRKKLRDLSADLPMIQFFPLQPLERLSDLLGMADVHLLPQIADAADLVLPSKLTNMLASGRPVVATTELDTALGQEVVGAGTIVPPADPEAFALAVRTLLDDAALRSSLGKAARDRAIERWDMHTILSRVKAQMEAQVRPSADSANNTASEDLNS